MAATPRLSKHLVQKGDAKPSVPTAKGETVSLTFKLDKERYQKLVAYGATFVRNTAKTTLCMKKGVIMG